MPVYEYDSTSTTYNEPALAYPAIPGVSVPGSPNPFVIDLVLTVYTPPTAKAKVQPVTVLPIMVDSNTVVGGNAVSVGAVEFPRIALEGFIDTPTVSTLEAVIPPATVAQPVQTSAITTGGVAITWADFIIICLEGRAFSNMWTKVDPLWFRDPYGRIFNNPKVLDFSAAYVEGVPGRTNFTMILKV